jgi:hypothetical protein
MKNWVAFIPSTAVMKWPSSCRKIAIRTTDDEHEPPDAEQAEDADQRHDAEDADGDHAHRRPARRRLLDHGTAGHDLAREPPCRGGSSVSGNGGGGSC